MDKRPLRVPLLIASFTLVAAWALLQGQARVMQSMAPAGCAAGGPASLQGALGSASTADVVEIVTGWHAFTRISHGTVIDRMATECISTPLPPPDPAAFAQPRLHLRNADTTARVWLLTDLLVFAPAYGVLLLLIMQWARRLPDPALTTSRRQARGRPEIPVLRGAIWLARRSRMMTALIAIAVIADWTENALILHHLASWWDILDRTGALPRAEVRLGLVHFVSIVKWLAVLTPLVVALVLIIRQVVRAAILLGRAFARLWVQTLLVVVFAVLAVVPDQGVDAIRRLSLWQWSSTIAVLALFVVTVVLSAGEVLKPLSPHDVPLHPARCSQGGDPPISGGVVRAGLLRAVVAARWGAVVVGIGGVIFVLSLVTGFRGLAIPAILVGLIGVVSIVLDLIDDLDIPDALAPGRPSATVGVASDADAEADRAIAVGRVAPCLAGVIAGSIGFATLRATAGDFALIGSGPSHRLILRESIGFALTVGTGLIVLVARRLLAWAGAWTDRRRLLALGSLVAVHVPVIMVHDPDLNLAVSAKVGTFSLIALFLSGFSLIGSIAARLSNLLMSRRRLAPIALPSALRLLRLRTTPIMGLLLVWALLAPMINNHTYHAVRQTFGAVTVPVTIDQMATSWVAAHPPAQATAADALPALLIASSGGGIRAAYWTAAVLDCVIERDGPMNDPCAGAADPATLASRRRAMLTMSGISGGSLGLTEYVAAVGGQWSSAGAPTSLPALWFRKRLGADFLAPTIAAWLFDDGLNSLLRPESGVDRAAVLERAWERPWPDDALGAGFFAGQTSGRQPMLLLNGFSVEDGCRVLTSALVTQPPRQASDCTKVISSGTAPAALSTVDLDAQLCTGQDITYATAALASARFPFVSPAGHLAGCNGGSPIEIVDGGYRETSGASTIDELWPELRAALATATTAALPNACVAPIFVQIDNGYASDQLSGIGRGTVGQLLAPLKAVMSSSSGQEAAARETSRELFSGANANWFRITTYAHPGSTAPLGWVLSSDAQDDLQNQLRLNGQTITAIRDLLDTPSTCS